MGVCLVPAYSILCRKGALNEASELVPSRDAKRTMAQFLSSSWLTSLLSTVLSQEQKDALILGDSFDADGLSTTNMTFTLAAAQVRCCCLCRANHFVCCCIFDVLC